MVMISPADRDDESGTGGQPHFADRQDVTGGRAHHGRIGGETVLRLGDADGDVAEAGVLERFQPASDRVRDGNVRRAIDLLRDGPDLVASSVPADTAVISGLARFDLGHHRVRQCLGARAAMRPMGAGDRSTPRAAMPSLIAANSASVSEVK